MRLRTIRGPMRGRLVTAGCGSMGPVFARTVRVRDVPVPSVGSDAWSEPLRPPNPR